MPETLQIKPLPPVEALEYFRAKGLEESFAWQDVWQEEHARAFTVAKAMRRDILQDIRDAVATAMAQGLTVDQFKSALQPLLEAKGWWGRQPMADPLTGEIREVQLGSARRLDTIFEVNMRTAYQAGRWKRLQETKKAFPFLRYVTVQDDKVRPQHRAWHGVVRPIDDPWWDTHYPPCGWRCRCTVQAFNERMLNARGFRVTERPPRFPGKPYVNPRTGEHLVIEEGIDPGFAYNPGKAYLEPVTPRPAAQIRPLPAGPSGDRPSLIPRPGPALLAPDVDAEEAQAAFLGGFGVSPTGSRIVQDVAGEDFVASPALFPSKADPPFSVDQLRGLPLVGQAIRDPDEIWWIWRQSKAGGPHQMMRRYIARLTTPDGQLVDVVVDVASGGSSPSWAFVTSAAGSIDIEALRSGELAWRR